MVKTKSLVRKESSKTSNSLIKKDNKLNKTSIKSKKKVQKMDESIDSEDGIGFGRKNKINRSKKIEKKKDQKKSSKKIVEIKVSISSKKISKTTNNGISDKANGKDKNDKKDTKKNSTSNQPADVNIIKVIEKGGAAVDYEVPNASSYYVLPDLTHQFNGKHFCSTLNFSDLKDNNNKFYLIQILFNQSSNQYLFWNRWGRVGYPGQNSKIPFNNKEDAIRNFIKKYKEKTAKGYTHIEIDYANEEETNKDKPKEKEEKKKNKDNQVEKKKEMLFDEGVKNLLNLIYDMKLMNQQMKEIGYDANKMPLGKLSQQMIKEGYEILRELEHVIKDSKKGDLFELSSRFYTVIPHNFGYQ